MAQSKSHKFSVVHNSTLLLILLAAIFYCQNLWAYQSAMVIAERAVIYADEQMSAPLGFIRKGKKIKVGDIARNRAQVYPIIVSGKMAYVRVIDLSTEMESVESGKLVAERFQKNTQDEHKTNYGLTVFNFASQIDLEPGDAQKSSLSSMNWLGFGLRGGTQINPKWDFDMMGNFLTAKSGEVAFNVIEFGVGASFRIFEQSRFKLRYFAQGLIVPFATYAYGDDFRVNGYGLSAGTGLNMVYRLGKYAGIEGFGGLYYMKLSGFDAPKPYTSISPTFLGTRLGLGFNYQF